LHSQGKPAMELSHDHLRAKLPVGPGVGEGVGEGVGAGVGFGVGAGASVGAGVGLTVGAGASVGEEVGAGVGTSVGAGVGCAVGAGVGEGPCWTQGEGSEAQSSIQACSVVKPVFQDATLHLQGKPPDCHCQSRAKNSAVAGDIEEKRARAKDVLRTIVFEEFGEKKVIFIFGEKVVEVNL
jgi:hypothetical protein